MDLQAFGDMNATKTRDDEETGEEKKESDHLDDASSTVKDEIGHQDTIIEITNIGHQVEIEQKLARTRTRSYDSCSTATTVSFGSVQVREYERVIDSTDKYMGLALGWSYNEIAPSPVKERNHATKYSVSTASRGGDETRMKRTNGSERYGMLLRYGYVQKELKAATREAATFYEQRQRDAARSLVVAEQRADPKKPQRRPLLRSMFG